MFRYRWYTIGFMLMLLGCLMLLAVQLLQSPSQAEGASLGLHEVAYHQVTYGEAETLFNEALRQADNCNTCYEEGFVVHDAVATPQAAVASLKKRLLRFSASATLAQRADMRFVYLAQTYQQLQTGVLNITTAPHDSLLSAAHHTLDDLEREASFGFFSVVIRPSYHLGMMTRTNTSLVANFVGQQPLWLSTLAEYPLLPRLVFVFVLALSIIYALLRSGPPEDDFIFSSYKLTPRGC